MSILIQFSCQNHKSIKEKAVFSTLAGKDTFMKDKTYKINEGNILKSAVIYGANGSGKSNFIDAVAFVKNLVLQSISYQPGQGILQKPHKMCGLSVPSSYEMHFITDNIRFVFGFSVTNMLISEEYLYYFPHGKQTKIYERNEHKLMPGYNFRGKFKTCMEVIKPNRLVLSCAANFTSIPEIQKVFKFFDDELVIYHPSNQSNWLNYSLYQINSSEKMKDSVIKFMNDFGLGVKDIKVIIDRKKIESSELPPFLSDEFKKILLEKNMESITASIVYDMFETDLMNEESTGVQKLFGLLCPLIDILTNGKILLCDELESSLHEALVFEIVKLFIRYESDKFAQLIFTTHETGLLNLDMFRRDQIWFTELNGKERSTVLYSLAEIKNVRKDENLSKGYITGKYGAIPMLNLDFASIISKIEE